MARARTYALQASLPPQDVMTIPRDQADTDENRLLVLSWLRANYDTVVARTTERAPNHFPWMLAGKSQDLVDEGTAFLQDPSRCTPEMEEELGKVADVVRRRSALQQQYGAGLAAFLGAGEAAPGGMP
jgi:hypothetical protein